MTPQERDLILGVAQRLRNANLSQKDAEAERFIQAEIGPQRDALYLLTQAVIVQEQGLRHAQERIQQLEAASSGHGSFLGNLFGGGSSAPPPAPAPAAPLATGQGSGIGTFLGTAAASAVGAVGGQLIYDSLRQLAAGGATGVPWAHRGGGSFGPSASASVTPANEPGPGRAAEPQDTDYSGGGGGDFGSEDDDSGGGGDFGDDQEEDSADDDTSEDDSNGGGDF